MGGGGALAGLGGQRADHLVAEPGLASQHRGDLIDVSLCAGDHHTVLERAELAGPLEAAAQQEPAQDQDRDADGRGEHEEPGET